MPSKVSVENYLNLIQSLLYWFLVITFSFSVDTLPGFPVKAKSLVVVLNVFCV